MKKFVVLLVVLAFVAATAMFAVANNGPTEVKIDTKMGTVTFQHAKHQERVSDCKTCHHNGVEAGACRSCHDGTKAPKAKTVFHKLCKDCHKKQNGPTKCKECHVK